MNDQYKDWNKYKHKVKERWNKLSDQDLNQINGRREHLLSLLEQRYGWQKPQAEEELKKFEKMCAETCDKCEKREPHQHRNEPNQPNRNEHKRKAG